MSNLALKVGDTMAVSFNVYLTLFVEATNMIPYIVKTDWTNLVVDSTFTYQVRGFSSYCGMSDDCNINLGLIYKIKSADPAEELSAYFAGSHSTYGGGQPIGSFGDTIRFLHSLEPTQSCFTDTLMSWSAPVT